MFHEQFISAGFPFNSKFIEVHGSKIHYIDEGEGDPVVFLHGIPTSSYLWRNIIPPFALSARCIAPDLIGMGKSDKPDIEYHITDYIDYMSAFLDKLKLNKITLVVHAWGSIIGFDYARRHPDKIKALAFYEAHIKPLSKWEMLPLPVRELAFLGFNRHIDYQTFAKDENVVAKFLATRMLRKLTSEEMACYVEPFKTLESKKPLWRYLQELPLGEGSEDINKIIANNSKYLQKSHIPKLMLYAIPGFITHIDAVVWAKDHLSNLTLADVGEALHFAQESQTQNFRQALAQWYISLRHL